MNIAIIGHGNVGGTLARQFAGKGHRIYIGARAESEKTQALAEVPGISVHSVDEALEASEVIVVAVPSPATLGLAKSWKGRLDGKVIIDTTNNVRKGPDPYATGLEAFKQEAGATDVVKCFNTTGFENMADPVYNGEGVDMFVAGDSVRAKQVAIQLALEIGFGQVHDFGGDNQASALEKFAFGWINLAIFQGMGRNIAIRVVSR